MPANPWELRTDVRPLDAAAQAWREVAEVMARRGDEIVEVARRTTEGWQAAAADSYEQHRRQVLMHLDVFTTLAGQVAASLQAIGAVVTAAQEELDQSWATVAMVPHEAVGESRHLVFHPAEERHRGAVARAQREAEDVRGRLRTALDLEGERLRAARSELVVVRHELTTLSGGRSVAGARAGADDAGVPPLGWCTRETCPAGGRRRCAFGGRCS
ncbi:MAG: WXG100 family type VII secretion target, partial [Terrabacter sp.]